MTNAPEHSILGPAPRSSDPSVLTPAQEPKPTPFGPEPAAPAPIVVSQPRAPAPGESFTLGSPSVSPDGQVVMPSSGSTERIFSFSVSSPTPAPAAPPPARRDPSELGLAFNGHVWTYAPEMAAQQLAAERERQAAEARAALAVARRSWPPASESRHAAELWELDRDEIDRGLVEAVERTVRLAAATLAIPAPRVRWLPPDADCRGVTFSASLREIWVKRQPLAAAKNTALHELRHTYQLTADRWRALGLHTMEQRQRDADEFARTWQPVDEMKGDGQVLAHKTARTTLDVKAGANGSWEIAGYASTWGDPPDSYGDVIARGAFSASIAKRPTKFLYEHREPIGQQLELREDDHGLWGRWSVVDTTFGRDARALAQAGVLDSLSIGYILRDSEQRRDGVRVIKSVDLFEVSAVAIPANANALITDVRSAAPSSPPRLDIRRELHLRRAVRSQRRVPAATVR